MAHIPMVAALIVNYLLSYDELTGYDFIKYCKKFGISASSGNVYPQLKKMNESGIISYREEGKKKVYTLTDEGREIISNSAIEKLPQFIREAMLKNMMITSEMDWTKEEDIDKLILNFKGIIDFLQKYKQNLN